MSRSLIRRTYRGDTVPSRRARHARQRAILAQHGRRIHVLELEGAIFFGTVERLADAIERAVADGARFLILDLGRVTDVDMAGGRPFPDSDRAIEWAEDQVIAATVSDGAVTEALAFADLDVFRDLSETELATVRAMLEARHYTAGDVVIVE